jgi:hypothetical protein
MILSRRVEQTGRLPSPIASIAASPIAGTTEGVQYYENRNNS